MSDEPDTEVDRVIIECPKCGTQGEVPKWWLGYETECKSCENKFTQVIPTKAVTNAE